MLLFYVASTIITLVVILFLSYFLSKKFDLYDIPSERKIHTKPILCIGGVFFYLITLFSIMSYLFFQDLFIDLPRANKRDLFAIFLILSCIFVIGIFDDLRGIDGFRKIIYLFLISLLFFSLISENSKITIFNTYLFGDIKLNEVSAIVLPSIATTIFIIFLGLIDGINSLLSSVCLFLLSILIYHTHNNLGFALFFSIIVFLSLFPFIALNFKSKFFLGNSGAMILPFIVAILFYFSYDKIFNENISNIEFLILSIWLIIFDVCRVFGKRILSKNSPFTADKNHLHHILLRKYSLIKSLSIYNGLNYLPILILILINQ